MTLIAIGVLLSKSDPLPPGHSAEDAVIEP